MSKSTQKRLAVQTGKPVVHVQYFMTQPEVGKSCRLVAHDHPDIRIGGFFGYEWIDTSAVEKIHEDGTVETRNTLYVPAYQLIRTAANEPASLSEGK